MTKLHLTRRDMLLGGVGLVMAGCAPERPIPFSRPRPPWPKVKLRPSRTEPLVIAKPPPPPPPPSPQAATVPDVMAWIPRSHWAGGSPIGRRLRPMGRINRITVHHEGWKTVHFDDHVRTAQRLEAIRKSHLERLTAGDIGYHVIIDRAGRRWAGRDLEFQGAHVRGHNQNNAGVMVLGNFNRQQPTPKQYAALQEVLQDLMARFHVSARNIFTHRELGPTTCPGTTLQSHMLYLRQRGLG